jgi:hypothetical protein
MSAGALVLGIIGTILALIPGLSIVGAVLGVLAVILGVVGRKSAATNNRPTGSATAGMVLGIIGLVIGSAMFILCAMAKKGIEDGLGKALNDPEVQKKLNDPKLNKELDDAFKKALEQPK